MFRKRPTPPQQQTIYATSMADAPTQIWLPVPPKRSPRRKWLPLLSLGLLVALAALLAVLAGGAALIYHSDWVLPGVHTLGVDLGRRTTAEAESALTVHWRQRAIVLEAEGTSWLVSPEKLGITLDPAATVARAHEQGRSWASLQAWLDGGGSVIVSPVWTIDLAAAEANLQGLAAQFEIPPQNAGVAWRDGRFTATPPVDGRVLDIASTLTWLEQSAAQVVTTSRLQLPTQPVTPAITDVGELVEAANHLLQTTVAIHAYDPVRDEAVDWTVAPEAWGQWLTPVIDPANPTRFDWTLNEEKAQAFLAEQAQSLGADRYVDVAGLVTAVADAIKGQNSAVSLRIYHQPRAHVVQAGETIAGIGRAYGIPYPWIQGANPDVSDALYVGQTITIPSPDDLLPLPVVENKRIVVSISQQKMWVYENGALRWEWLSSTGIDDSPTSPGMFQIQTHEPNAYAGNWDLWMPYFMGIYRPVPTSAFMNGFHGFPTRDGQTLLWTGNLGHKVTYGCILISTDNAAQLYDWAEEGVVVEIRP